MKSKDEDKRRLYLPEGKQKGWKKKPSRPMKRTEKRDRMHEQYLQEVGFGPIKGPYSR